MAVFWAAPTGRATAASRRFPASSTAPFRDSQSCFALVPGRRLATSYMAQAASTQRSSSSSLSSQSLTPRRSRASLKSFDALLSASAGVSSRASRAELALELRAFFSRLTRASTFLPASSISSTSSMSCPSSVRAMYGQSSAFSKARLRSATALWGPSRKASMASETSSKAFKAPSMSSRALSKG